MNDRTGHQPVETAREARQGYLDRPVLMVLIVSLGLTIAVLAMLWMARVF